jgi:anti-anti-sigma regulatory factor
LARAGPERKRADVVRRAPPSALRHDAHWIIPELDAHGQIDRHTAMCLRVALADAVDADDVLIDLRDLSAVDEHAIAILRWARDACRAHDVHLTLLIGARAPHDALAHALARAGLTLE